MYNGDVTSDRYPTALIHSLVPLAKGVDKKFSHGDVAFAGGNVIRIGDLFAAQMRKAAKAIRGEEDVEEGFFKGLSYGSFDGVLQEIDARGAFVRGKLILIPTCVDQHQCAQSRSPMDMIIQG